MGIDERVAEIFASNIESVMSEGDMAERCKGLAFAVEVEPGPLFALNGKNAIEMFARHLRRPGLKHCKEFVGLNLDIAHMALLGMSPEHFMEWWLQKGKDPLIPEKPLIPIVSCHISDHSSGHMGDLVVPTLGFGVAEKPKRGQGNGIFGRWLEKVSTIGNHQFRYGEGDKEAPKFRNHVSVEIEAAQYLSQVVESVTNVAREMRKLNILQPVIPRVSQTEFGTQFETQLGTQPGPLTT